MLIYRTLVFAIAILLSYGFGSGLQAFASSWRAQWST